MLPPKDAALYANAELSAQIGRIREAVHPLAAAVETLGTGIAATAQIDAGDCKVLFALAREIQDVADMLRDFGATDSFNDAE